MKLDGEVSEKPSLVSEHAAGEKGLLEGMAGVVPDPQCAEAWMEMIQRLISF